MSVCVCPCLAQFSGLSSGKLCVDTLMDMAGGSLIRVGPKSSIVVLLVVPVSRAEKFRLLDGLW